MLLGWQPNQSFRFSMQGPPLAAGTKTEVETAGFPATLRLSNPLSAARPIQLEPKGFGQYAALFGEVAMGRGPSIAPQIMALAIGKNHIRSTLNRLLFEDLIMDVNPFYVISRSLRAAEVRLLLALALGMHLQVP